MAIEGEDVASLEIRQKEIGKRRSSRRTKR
jgi:hypothetical protein